MHVHTSNILGCAHNNIKFCTVCKRPYCVDCNKEWYDHNWTYYPVYTQPWIPIYTPYVAPEITWTATGTTTKYHYESPEGS